MSLQEKIIKELGVKPTIDAQEEIRKSVDFLKDCLKKYPFIKTYVLGFQEGKTRPWLAVWHRLPWKKCVQKRGTKLTHL